MSNKMNRKQKKKRLFETKIEILRQYSFYWAIIEFQSKENTSIWILSHVHILVDVNHLHFDKITAVMIENYSKSVSN